MLIVVFFFYYSALTYIQQKIKWFLLTQCWDDAENSANIADYLCKLFLEK